MALSSWARGVALVGVAWITAGTICVPYQNVGIESNPEGAEVYMDGTLMGVTPLRLRIPTRADHSIYLKKEGFRPQLVVLNSNQPQDAIDFLTPADIRVRMIPGVDSMGRDLEVETEPETPE